MAGSGGGCWRLALGQMLVEPGHPARNLERAEARLELARSKGAEVVLLPEALDFGWTHASARRMAGSIPGGRTARILRAAARRLGVFICAGLVERSGDRLFNAAVLIGPDGRILLHHRKIHELAFARSLYAGGDRLGVVDTPLGRLGVMICADAFVHGQVVSRTLANMGAEVILSPCAWAVPPEHDPEETPYGQLWLDNYQPVAREFGLWVAGCSNVGTIIDGDWAGWRCIGCSLVVAPTGAAVAKGSYGECAEELILVDIPRVTDEPMGRVSVKVTRV